MGEASGFASILRFNLRQLIQYKIGKIKAIGNGFMQNILRQQLTLRKLLTLVSMLCVFIITHTYAHELPSGIVVLQTDFGLKDGAVNAIKGVIYSVDKGLLISDLTHEIPPYNILQASYWLNQVATYWPKGTVFVSVVDPGVGTQRRSIVAESKNGYYFVTPDNGTLTFIADNFGINAIRQIDENKNRLKGSNASYTFHGRDVYGYTAAKLAANKISFNEVGPEIHGPVVKLAIEKAYLKNNKLYGSVIVLDPEYGNVWTNIDNNLVHQFQMKQGQSYKVTIFYHHVKKFQGNIPFQNTFGEVREGANLLYLNSLMNLAIGANQDNFAEKMRVNSGQGWHIVIE